jgi:hypothetical protein
VVAATAAAPRHQVRADALAELLVQLVLVEPAASGERVARRVGHLVERVGRREAVLVGQASDLPPELCAELVVVAGDQRPAVEGEVARRQGVDRPAHDVRDDDLAAVDRLVIRLARDALGARGQCEQRRIAREVRCGAGGRLGEPAHAA